MESREHFADVADFNPETGEFTALHRDELSARVVMTQPLRGHFAMLGARRAVLFRAPDGLHLRIGEREFAVDVLDLSARWSIAGRGRRLELLDLCEKPHAVAEYELSPEPVAAGEDPTPFASEEDADFGLFIAHVLQDPERRSRLYR